MTAGLLALDPAQVKPGWIGLLVTLAMAVALAVLMVSFTRRLKNIDVDREQEPELESIDESDPSSSHLDDRPPRRT
jgi:hypothetical protein